MHGYIFWEQKWHLFSCSCVSLCKETTTWAFPYSPKAMCPRMTPLSLCTRHLFMLSNPCWRTRLPFSSLYTSIPYYCQQSSMFMWPWHTFIPYLFLFFLLYKLQPTLGTLQLSPCIRQRAHTVLNAIKQWHLSLTSFQAPHHQKWEASHGSSLSLFLSLSSSSATSFAQQRPRASYAKWCSSPILFPNLKWWYQSTWAPRLCLCVISIFNKSNSLTSLTWHLTNDWINMHHRNTMNQLHGSMTFLLSQLGSGWWG